MTRNSDQDAYAAGQLGDHIRGDLEDKPPEYLYPHTGFVRDDDERSLVDWLAAEGLEDGALYERAVAKQATATTTDAIRGGNVSQMQFPVGIVRNTGDGEEALTTMARRLSAEGAIYLALGPPGSGKTALMLDVGTVWRAMTGGAVITNVTSWPRADRYVETNREMEQAMGEIDGQVLAILDEGSQTLTSRGTDAPKADQFAKSLKYVRKSQDGKAKQGSVLLAGHTRADLGAEFRRLASGAFEKVSRADPGRVRLLDSEGGRDRFEEGREFTGVTDTAEDFREHEASTFRVVTDQEAAEDDGPSADEAAKQARREASIETAIRAVKPWTDDGMSYREAAQLVPQSKSWVGERAREWEDGEHRDVVDAPE